jgi:hypothetical protein
MASIASRLDDGQPYHIQLALANGEKEYDGVRQSTQMSLLLQFSFS